MYVKDVENQIITIFGEHNVYYRGSNTFMETDQFKNQKEHIRYSFQVLSISHMELLDLIKYFKDLVIEIKPVNIPFSRVDDEKIRLEVTLKDINDILKRHKISDYNPEELI